MRRYHSGSAPQALSILFHISGFMLGYPHGPVSNHTPQMCPFLTMSTHRLEAQDSVCNIEWMFFGWVLLVGTWVRWFHLTHQGIDDHEVISWLLATKPSLKEVVSASFSDNSPPLYQLVLRVWIGLFGDTPFALRSLSAIFGSLSLPAMYFCGSRLFSKRIGICATAMVAWTLPLVDHAQYARSTSLLLLLSILCVTFWPFFSENKNPASLFAFNLFGFLASFCHFFGFALYLCLLLYIAVFTVMRGKQRDSKAKGLFKTLCYSLPGLILYLPFFVPAAAHRIFSNEVFWTTYPNMRALIYLAGYYFNSYYFIAVSVFVLAIVMACQRRRLFEPQREHHLAALAALFVSVVVFKSTISTPVLVERYFVVLFPIGALCLASVYSRLPVRPQILVALLLSLFIHSLARPSFYERRTVFSDLVDSLHRVPRDARIMVVNLFPEVLTYFKKQEGFVFNVSYETLKEQDPTGLSTLCAQTDRTHRNFLLTMGSPLIGPSKSLSFEGFQLREIFKHETKIESPLIARRIGGAYLYELLPPLIPQKTNILSQKAN